MKQIILYGNRYGSAHRYADKFSELTGIPAISCEEAPPLTEYSHIIYFGGLYSGAIRGLDKAFSGFTPKKEQIILIAAVGLTDSTEPQNSEAFRLALKKQISEPIRKQAEFFFLRGSIDYNKLSLNQWIILSLLYQSIRNTPTDKLAPENRILELYEKQAESAESKALEPLLSRLPA